MSKKEKVPYLIFWIWIQIQYVVYILLQNPCLNLEPMSTLFSFFSYCGCGENKKRKLLLTQIKRKEKEWNYWISEKCKPHLFLSQLSVKKCMCELVGFLHFSWATRGGGGKKKKIKEIFLLRHYSAIFWERHSKTKNLRLCSFDYIIFKLYTSVGPVL